MTNQNATSKTLFPTIRQGIVDFFADAIEQSFRATYSAEDNKLRLYLNSDFRFSAEQWEIFSKKLGFKWASKQGLFVAPAWTPAKEDFCLMLAGTITAEQTTLLERSTVRAERYDGYRENRIKDMNAFGNALQRLTDNIAVGQPLLNNHHSEGKLTRIQKRVKSTSDRTIWAASAANYWAGRAEAVENHANRKNDFRVRANRIEKLLAELRVHQRKINHAYHALNLWDKVKSNANKEIQKRHVETLIGGYRGDGGYSPEGYSQKLENNEITVLEAINGSIEYCQGLATDLHELRWINHILNRLNFERSELGLIYSYDKKLTAGILQVFFRSQGTDKPLAKKTDDTWLITSKVPFPMHLAEGNELSLTEDQCCQLMQSVGYEVPSPKATLPPILNFEAHNIKVTMYNEPRIMKQIELTQAEYKAIYNDYRGCKYSVCGEFRVKICRDPNHQGYGADWLCVFITDSKVDSRPESKSINVGIELVESAA